MGYGGLDWVSLDLEGMFCDYGCELLGLMENNFIQVQRLLVS
jgi:hypothetical protein